MSEVRKDKKVDNMSTLGAIIKETYLHPLEESVISSSGKVVERNGLKKK